MRGGQPFQRERYMQMLCETEALWADRNVENRRENNEKRLEKW